MGNIKSYVGRGQTEIDSVYDLVKQIGGGVRIEMSSRSVYYKNNCYFLYIIKINNEWESYIL